MPQKKHRLEQVNEFIKHRFAEIIREEIPLPENTLVTVTEVKTSTDLRHARLGLSIYPTHHTNHIFATICRNLKHLKYLLHQHITFKYAPDITVYIDTKAQEVFTLDELLIHIKERQEKN